MGDWANEPGRWHGRISGADLGGPVSILFFSSDRPGAGPPLHWHPYDEVFIVREGRALFTVGDEKIEASEGDILMGPAGVPHKFKNLGPGRLETTDIHLSDHFEQVEVDDPEG